MRRRPEKRVRFREPVAEVVYPAPSRIREQRGVGGMERMQDRARGVSADKRGEVRVQRCLRRRRRLKLWRVGRRRYVRIWVNVRYRGDRNERVLLRRDVGVFVEMRANILDSWRKARRVSGCLRRLKFCGKVVVPCGRDWIEIERGRVKEALKVTGGRRRWLFVVERKKYGGG